MGAGIERDARLGLAGAEMQVIEVVRQRPVERRQPRIDQEMVVPGVGLLHAGRCDAHVVETEADDGPGRDAQPVLHVDEIDAGVGRRGAPRRRRRTLRGVDDVDGDASDITGGLCGM